MNKRIKLLWDQAAKLESDPSWEGQTKFMEKFAELIVEESITVMARHDYHGAWLGEKIREHFGIEQ